MGCFLSRGPYFAILVEESRTSMAHLFYPIKLYIKNPGVAIMLGVSLALNIGSWVWLLWQIGPREELIFLHYNILFGVDLIGPWYRILFIPIFGFGIILANTLLGWVLFNKDKFAAQLLHVVSVFCQVLLLIGSAILVFLNV